MICKRSGNIPALWAIVEDLALAEKGRPLRRRRARMKLLRMNIGGRYAIH